MTSALYLPSIFETLLKIAIYPPRFHSGKGIFLNQCIRAPTDYLLSVTFAVATPFMRFRPLVS